MSLPLALLLAAVPATDAVDMRFEGDPDCGRDPFVRSLETHLAGSTSPARSVRATLRTARDRHSRWLADLSLETADSRSARRFTGATCFEVCDAAAFVTAVVVDPGVLDRPRPEPTSEPTPPEPTTIPETAPIPEPPADPAPDPAPPELVTPPPPAPPVRKPPPRRRPGGFLRLAGGLEALGLPAVAPQISLAGGLLGRSWRSELALAYRAPTRAVADPDPDAGATIRMWTLGARGCGVLRPGPLELGLCGGIEAGQAIGAGYGFPGARRDPIPWLAVTVGPTLSWAPRRWLALWIAPELAVPVLRGRFAAAGLGTLYRVAPVSLRLALGLELRMF